MEHYICPGGCGGVSNKPGVCQAPKCPKHGQPLEKCNCQDAKHQGILKKEKYKSENL